MAPIDVWLVDEGNPGHRVQSEGVLDALQRIGLELSVTYIRCSSNLPGILRPAARRLMDLPHRSWLLRIVRQFTDFGIPTTPIPRFIISSGGRSAYVSRALSRSMERPSVFVGLPRPFPARWFTVVMTPVEWPLHGTTVIPTGVTPNSVTPDKCRAAAVDYWQGNVPQNCWALLIGGNSASHRFRRADWEHIVNAVNALARKHGIRWLISTSRRTGPESERLIYDLLDSDVAEDCTFVSSKPKKVVMPYLGAARIVFVTQDSRTMLAEAVLSGRPVVAVAPKDAHIDGAINAASFEYYCSLPQTTRIDAAEMPDYNVHADPTEEYSEPGEGLLRAARELQVRLKL